MTSPDIPHEDRDPPAPARAYPRSPRVRRLFIVVGVVAAAAVAQALGALGDALSGPGTTFLTALAVYVLAALIDRWLDWPRRSQLVYRSEIALCEPTGAAVALALRACRELGAKGPPPEFASGAFEAAIPMPRRRDVRARVRVAATTDATADPARPTRLRVEVTPIGHGPDAEAVGDVRDAVRDAIVRLVTAQRAEPGAATERELPVSSAVLVGDAARVVSRVRSLEPDAPAWIATLTAADCGTEDLLVVRVPGEVSDRAAQRAAQAADATMPPRARGGGGYAVVPLFPADQPARIANRMAAHLAASDAPYRSSGVRVAHEVQRAPSAPARANADAESEREPSPRGAAERES